MTLFHVTESGLRPFTTNEEAGHLAAASSWAGAPVKTDGEKIRELLRENKQALGTLFVALVADLKGITRAQAKAFLEGLVP